MHCDHHSSNRLTLGAALALLLALAACAPFTRPDPPGLLGSLIDRAPPSTQIKATGPYGDPLAEPVPPLLSADIAEQIVGAPLRSALSAEAKLSLADASMRAAAARTGTIVQWQSADASGAAVPARDVYRSHRGVICRDIQQQAKTADGPAVVDLVTLCHSDLGDGRVYWLPGSPD
jgi:surface antigen